MAMFKRTARRVPGLRVAAGQMQNESLGRLPRGVAEGQPSPQPASEYIAEAVPPSEDIWAREQARYRAKRDSRQQH
ncbi:MAG: hypothetical protein JO372_01620 [Solirubrobacterales bacterium]|nr:hypothetical protein [Solirubrobacterales bacterium]